MGASPTMRTPCRCAWLRRRCHCCVNCHCTKHQKPISPAASSRRRPSAASSRQANSRGPAVPRRAMALVQRHEQGVVVQPVALLLGESACSCLAVVVRGAPAESLPRFAQQRHAPRRHPRVVGAGGLEARVAGAAQPATLHQFAQVHQQGAAGKGGNALVGRVARAHRVERQHLPEGLPRRHQPVHEVVGRGAEVAAAVRSGQRGGMQQHTAAARVEERGAADVMRIRLRSPGDSMAWTRTQIAGPASS